MRPRFETALGPARPSPSTGAMQLAYTLSAGCDVRLDVYDIAGRRIRSLDEGYRTEGAHVALWDGRDDSGVSAPPGVYLGRMTAGSWQGQRKLVLVAR